MNIKCSPRRCVWLVLATLSVITISSLNAAGPPGPPEHEFSIEFLNTSPNDTPTQVLSGWPITLRLWANNEKLLGLSRPTFTPNKFSLEGQKTFFVFDEPDLPVECLSWVNPACPPNETFLEFTPDTDLPGVLDLAGNKDCQMALTESGGGGSPTIFTFDPATETNTRETRVGPDTGPTESSLEMRCFNRLALGEPCAMDSDCQSDFPFATCDLLEGRCSAPQQLGFSCAVDADCKDDFGSATCEEIVDGVGLGADDDVTGLVLLVDTGVGLKFNADFILDDPLTQQNIAGMLTTVAYELDDATGRTSLLAHMTVPRGLIEPIALVDNCVQGVGDDPNCQCIGSSSPTCTGGLLARIDGGPQMSFESVGDLRNFLENKVITLRAFVVSGKAPSVLEDLNSDGIVDAEDAEEAGFQLLSGEEVITIRQIHEEILPRHLFDFDGNGIAPVVAPSSPGSITGVPR